MPDNRAQDDADIILAAYAEKVGEAFKVFAENLAMGQSEQSCMDQFKRALLWSRKARDLTLQTLRGDNFEPGAHGTAAREEIPAEPLSAEDQALIDQVLRGTTGAAPPPPPPQRYRGR